MNRIPPRPAPGCGGMLSIVGVVIAVVVIGGIAIFMSLNNQPATVPQPTLMELESLPSETPTATLTPVLDGWSLTGTALFYVTNTATPDYCWWLTPTPTASATLIYTPDAWQAEGTAMYEATYPPKMPTATPDLPHAWCNNIPTLTPTLTPLSLNRLVTKPAVTPTLTPTITPLSLPTRSQNNNGGFIQITPPDSPTVAPIWTAVPTLPLPTVAPTKIKKTKVPTDTPTFTPTLTLTPSDTPTATATPTETFTPTATATPNIQSVLTSCEKRYPEFVIQNLGVDMEFLDWSIIHQETGLYANMGTIEFIPAGFSFVLDAPNASGTGGTFALYWSSDANEQATPAPSMTVFCEYPTATPTEPATETPTETPTIEVTP